MAKVYGDYASITQDYFDIIEMQTKYCRQEISMTRPVEETDLIKLIHKKRN